MVEKYIQNDIYLLESWCVEKRKNLFYTDQDQKIAVDELSLSKSVDDLIEKSWIYPNKEYFDELLILVETKKISGKLI